MQTQQGKAFSHSWYYHNEYGIPPEILIGPAGHECEGWHELAPVATESDRQGNPFYMEHECRCVMRVMGIPISYKEGAGSGVYWRNINYAVPDVPIDNSECMNFLFSEAYTKFKQDWIKQHG